MLSRIERYVFHSMQVVADGGASSIRRENKLMKYKTINICGVWRITGAILFKVR